MQQPLYGLIGGKLGHSYSKIIHEQIADYTYDLLPLPTEAEARVFMEKRAFAAINVTIPYKQLVIPYCDEVDPKAKAIGAVNIPVVGLGGIATGKDALEFIMAGATAVQVGAANFANPRAMETIADEMAAWMDKNGVKTLDEIRGCARHAE